jgi:xylulokinase
MEAVNFIGGGANSAVWSQIIADVLNRPINQMSEPLMSNSRGAAMLALLALGKMDINEAAKSVAVQKVFQPNADNKNLYSDMFDNYIDVYNRNKPIFARLNK